jgi:hypothetical protein
MSGEAKGQVDFSAEWAEQKRKGLRVAIAVTAGFIFAVATGAIIPFLGPLFAAQFLLASSRPLRAGQTLGAAVLILVAGFFFMLLTAFFGDKPMTFLMLLGLVYFLLFFAQAIGKSGAAIFLIQVAGIMVPLLGLLNETLASSILSILTTGVATGAVLMWLAHVIIPEPAGVSVPPPPAPLPARPYLRALANTFILLTAVTVCLTNDQLSSAMVIPITVTSLLGQFDIVRSGRAAIGLMVVNFLGGVIASFAFALLNLRPNLFSMGVIMLVVTLVLGGRAAGKTTDAQMYGGALTTFLILFGLGVSPVPGSAAESFQTRIIYVAAAIIYTFILAALLWPRAPQDSKKQIEGAS